MKNLVWLIALSALALAGGSALQSSEPEFELARAHVETADMLDQMEPDTGERDLYAADAATLHRTPNGISVRINMPTPEPGTYRYPGDDEPTVAPPGHPEVFTLWVFVFDSDADAVEGRPWTGAFHGAGHPVGGPNLTLSGHISTDTEPFAGNHLENLQEAEIHLAVAPHGGLDPEIMPEQSKTPVGGPPLWWVAFFDAPE